MTDASERPGCVLVHARIAWGSNKPPLQRLAELAAAVEASHPGNHYYRFSTDITNPTHFYLNEEWETIGDFKHHSTMPETLEIGAAVRNGATGVELRLHTIASTQVVPFETASA